MPSIIDTPLIYPRLNVSQGAKKMTERTFTCPNCSI